MWPEVRQDREAVCWVWAEIVSGRGLANELAWLSQVA